MRAPLIPEVALVELPPKKPSLVSEVLGSSRVYRVADMEGLTVLVQDDDITAVEVDRMCGTETGH